MYQFEEVTKDEGLAFSKELNAIYERTSAKVAQGELFNELFNIGKKFLHPDNEITSNMANEELKNKGEKLQREKINYILNLELYQDLKLFFLILIGLLFFLLNYYLY